MKKSLEGNKKSVPLQSPNEKGVSGRRHGAREKQDESSLKRLEVQASKARSQFKAGQTRDIKDIYKEEFDPGSG